MRDVYGKEIEELLKFGLLEEYELLSQWREVRVRNKDQPNAVACLEIRSSCDLYRTRPHHGLPNRGGDICQIFHISSEFISRSFIPNHKRRHIASYVFAWTDLPCCRDQM